MCGFYLKEKKKGFTSLGLPAFEDDWNDLSISTTTFIPMGFLSTPFYFLYLKIHVRELNSFPTADLSRVSLNCGFCCVSEDD